MMHELLSRWTLLAGWVVGLAAVAPYLVVLSGIALMGLGAGLALDVRRADPAGDGAREDEPCS